MTDTPDIAGLRAIAEAADADAWTVPEVSAPEGMHGPAFVFLNAFTPEVVLGLLDLAEKAGADQIEEMLAALKKAVDYFGAPSGGSFDGMRDDDAVDVTIKVRIGDIKDMRAALARAQS